jgi:hypothetical protein
MELRRTDRRGAHGDDAIEQIPAIELDDGRAQERMRRQRIAIDAISIDERDPQSTSGEQHGRGGPGAARCDNHSIVLDLVHGRAPRRRRGGRGAG